MKRYAIIVAAGTGSRMNSELPKQFLLLRHKPVLAYSLEAFYRHDPQTSLIVVLAESEIARWKALCTQYGITMPHTIVPGGATRTDSVRNGLQGLQVPSLVAIHDGARPLVDLRTIEACYQSADLHGSGVAAVPPKDSLRWIESPQANRALDRERVRIVQTPQTFHTDKLLEAFEKHGHEGATDDASLVERAGHRIHLVEGSYRNLKITTPEDLLLAEALLP